MNKSKYILVHRDMVVMYADTIVEIAKCHFGLKVHTRVDGNWAIEVQGKIVPTAYTSTLTNPENGYTKEEAELDYIRKEFNPRTFNRRWLSYAIYELGGLD